MTVRGMEERYRQQLFDEGLVFKNAQAINNLGDDASEFLHRARRSARATVSMRSMLRVAVRPSCCRCALAPERHGSTRPACRDRHGNTGSKAPETSGNPWKGWAESPLYPPSVAFGSSGPKQHACCKFGGREEDFELVHAKEVRDAPKIAQRRECVAG